MRELESAKKIIDFEDFLQANEFYKVIYLLFLQGSKTHMDIGRVLTMLPKDMLSP